MCIERKEIRRKHYTPNYVAYILHFLLLTISRMGNTKSLSKSAAVITKLPICANGGCKNRVTLGNIYCTLHEENPMRIGKLKEQKKQEPRNYRCMYNCLTAFC